MPIQLPDDLVVADFVEIQKIDFEPGSKRRMFSMYNVEMPINLWSIIKILVAQQLEPMAAYVVRFADNLFNLGWEVFS